MPNIDKIIAYEAGQLGAAEAVRLFADLVRTGAAWRLQGAYGRTAAALIDGGYLSVDGGILVDLDALEVGI